jgi:hypothetical protein
LWACLPASEPRSPGYVPIATRLARHSGLEITADTDWPKAAFFNAGICPALTAKQQPMAVAVWRGGAGLEAEAPRMCL